MIQASARAAAYVAAAQAEDAQAAARAYRLKARPGWLIRRNSGAATTLPMRA